MLTATEWLTTKVYGDTFALYNAAEFKAFLAPLRERLRLNGISEDVFKGQMCLDAGCGGGRGSALMAKAGGTVVGVDLSERNIETATRRVPVASFQQASLLALPFPDDSFDVVWCNGVLHHTDNPDRALQEITRVLKPGGHLWLYLYGAGGIYWAMVDWARRIVQDVPVSECIRRLADLGVPTPTIAELIDDWYVPHLRRYIERDASDRLRGLGYNPYRPLLYGMPYDTSQRLRGAAQRERDLMGQGDLRYFTQLTGETGDSEPLPPEGSVYQDAEIVTSFPFPHDADILTAARVHQKLRALLGEPGLFDLDELRATLE